MPNCMETVATPLGFAIRLSDEQSTCFNLEHLAAVAADNALGCNASHKRT
jgi:hypothetical protein